MEFNNCEDEVKLYLDAGYVSACEGCWRLYHFWMHEEKPAVVRLQVHTEDEQLVTWNNEVAGNLQEVLEKYLKLFQKKYKIVRAHQKNPG
jgi:hypothetical protein